MHGGITDNNTKSTPSPRWPTVGCVEVPCTRGRRQAGWLSTAAVGHSPCQDVFGVGQEQIVRDTARASSRACGPGVSGQHGRSTAEGRSYRVEQRQPPEIVPCRVLRKRCTYDSTRASSSATAPSRRLGEGVFLSLCRDADRPDQRREASHERAVSGRR